MRSLPFVKRGNCGTVPRTGRAEVLDPSPLSRRRISWHCSMPSNANPARSTESDKSYHAPQGDCTGAPSTEDAMGSSYHSPRGAPSDRALASKPLQHTISSSAPPSNNALFLSLTLPRAFAIVLLLAAAVHLAPEMPLPCALPFLIFGSHTLAFASPTPSGIPPTLDLLSAPLEAVLDHLEAGNVTSLALVDAYLARIQENNHQGLLFRAVIETAPLESGGGVVGVRDIAKELDAERRAGKPRGRVHGVPILVKVHLLLLILHVCALTLVDQDNCATEVSLGMNTTAGSFALRKFAWSWSLQNDS